VGCFKAHISIGYYLHLVRDSIIVELQVANFVHTHDLQPDPKQDSVPQAPDIDGNRINPQSEPVHNVAVHPAVNDEPADNEDDNGGVVAGPAVEAEVTLAKTICKHP